MEEPKKRLRGKQPPPSSYAVDTPPKPTKRLRGKQNAELSPPKMAKAKARPPNKGGPRAQQFMDTLKKHWRENAGAIGLAERVRKRQGKPPGSSKDAPPTDTSNVFSKMPESVRKVPEFSRKFREEILQVPMNGVTARENYAKLIAEREKY